MISTGTSANVIHDGVASHGRVRSRVTRPRDVALGCLAIYLAGAGIVLVSRGHFLLSLVHAAGIGLVAAVRKPRSGTCQIVGDLLPLVAFPILYSEIPTLIASLGTTYHDATVQSWERAIFGMQPSQRFAAAFPFMPLSELLHAGYLAYYLVIFVPPFLLYARRERRGFEETVAALAVTFALCWSIFAAFPVQGPRYLFSPPLGAPNGPVRRLALWVLASGSARGAAFPSSHMAICVVQTLMAARWQPRVSVIVAGITVLVGVGAVYGGFHYGIDMLAGTVFAMVVSAVALRAFPGRGGSPSE
jgi:membrane-associated phospholipid phosphatase